MSGAGDRDLRPGAVWLVAHLRAGLQGLLGSSWSTLYVSGVAALVMLSEPPVVLVIGLGSAAAVRLHAAGTHSTIFGSWLKRPGSVPP